MAAHDLVKRGVGFVPQTRNVFGSLTVEENLRVAAQATPRAGAGHVREALEFFPDLVPRARQLAVSLSGGQQQMLAISRGLMARPRLILLDEPSLGLAPLLVRQIFEIITALRKAGKTILLVEQMANTALQIADRAYVLEQGRIVMEGSARDLLSHPDVVRGYLGGKKSTTSQTTMNPTAY
jgi:branched-chain amino acid transport system ATP-binding protein